MFYCNNNEKHGNKADLILYMVFSSLGQMSSGLMRVMASLCFCHPLYIGTSQISKTIENLFFKFCINVLLFFRALSLCTRNVNLIDKLLSLLGPKTGSF